MPQEVPVSSRDHCAGIAQQRHDGVARGGGLPLVATDGANSKQGASNVLLGGTVARTIECLKHPARPCSLLAGQPSVGRDSPTVKRRQKAMRSFKPAEPVDIQGDDGYRWTGYRCQKLKLDLLAVGKPDHGLAITSGDRDR